MSRDPKLAATRCVATTALAVGQQLLVSLVRRYGTGQRWPFCSERTRVGAGEPHECGAALFI